MTIYHVRPKDLHAPGEHCNTYDCTGVVMKHEYDALAARLAEAERAIAAALECVEDNDMHGAQVILGVAMRAADNGTDCVHGTPSVSLCTLCEAEDAEHDAYAAGQAADSGTGGLWVDHDCREIREALSDSASCQHSFYLHTGGQTCRKCGLWEPL